MLRQLLLLLVALPSSAAPLLVALPSSAQPLRVDFLDVGQGDAILLTSPTGTTVLVDGGPEEHARALVARLRRVGGPLDLVLMTHPHADHLGGLPLVLERIGARQFLDGGAEHPSPHYVHLVSVLARRGVVVREARAGRSIDLGGGAVLTLLAPPTPRLSGTRSDANANSIVARVVYGATSLLLLGDAEPETERWLLGSVATLASDVVKVAHHGSGYSSTPAFVRRVAARLAVISVGAINDYQHPDPEVVRRWEQSGARVLRTDRDGEVSLVSDGTSFERVLRDVAVHDASVRFVASRSSHLFHSERCPVGRRIGALHRLTFSRRDDALASGRDPAADCSP